MIIMHLVLLLFDATFGTFTLVPLLLKAEQGYSFDYHCLEPHLVFFF